MSLSLNDGHRRYWQKVENTVVQIIELAIELLIAKSSLPRGEDELNREFYFCLIEANYILQKKNIGLEFNPVYEALNQPALEHNRKETRENKRPDFQWSFADGNAPTVTQSAKQFVLECKRLDRKTGTWNYTEQYWQGGIARFVSSEYGYGFNVESSAMLAYVQSDEPAHYHGEVNKILKQLKHNQLGPIEDKKSCKELSQMLTTEHSLKKIRLIHFWIEIQKYYS